MIRTVELNGITCSRVDLLTSPEKDIKNLSEYRETDSSQPAVIRVRK